MCGVFEYLYVSLYVCVCLRTCMCIFVCVCLCTGMYVFVCMCVSLYVCACVQKSTIGVISQALAPNLFTYF